MKESVVTGNLQNGHFPDLFRNVLEIDLGALAHNLKEIRGAAPRRRKVIAVVKADAYGHGMLPVSKRLEAEGCDALAVFSVEEALLLRREGISLPIVILMGALEREWETCVAHGLTPVVYRWEDALGLNAVAEGLGRTLDVHLKVDTGMCRIGAFVGEAEEILSGFARLTHLRLDGIVSHFAASEDPTEAQYTREQTAAFRRVLEMARRYGLDPAHNHISNSGACLNDLDTGAEMVRVGLTLYGAAPSRPLIGKAELKPVMSLRSAVIQVKRVPTGTSISYGRTYVTDRPSVIAVLPVGYSDGYFRGFSNNAELLIHGRRAPVRGRVCMNLTMADVTHIEGVQPGDPAVFLGRQGAEEITADELARRAGTISYEIFTSLGNANPKAFLNSMDGPAAEGDGIGKKRQEGKK